MQHNNISIGVIGYEHVGKSTFINSFLGRKLSKQYTEKPTYINVNNFDESELTPEESIEEAINSYEQINFQFPEHFLLNRNYSYTFIDIPGINNLDKIQDDKHYKYFEKYFDDFDFLFVIFDIKQFENPDIKKLYGELLNSINIFVQNQINMKTKVNVVFNKCDGLEGFADMANYTLDSAVFPDQFEKELVMRSASFVKNYGYEPFLLSANKSLYLYSGLNHNISINDGDGYKYYALNKDVVNRQINNVGFKSIGKSIDDYIMLHKNELINKHIDMELFELSSDPDNTFITIDKLMKLLDDVMISQFSGYLASHFKDMTENSVKYSVDTLSKHGNLHELDDYHQKYQNFASKFFEKFNEPLNNDNSFKTIFDGLLKRYHMYQFINNFNIESFKYLYDNNELDDYTFQTVVSKNIKCQNLDAVNIDEYDEHLFQSKLENSIYLIMRQVALVTKSPDKLYDVIVLYFKQLNTVAFKYFYVLLNSIVRPNNNDTQILKYIQMRLANLFCSMYNSSEYNDFDFEMWSKADTQTTNFRFVINGLNATINTKQNKTKQVESEQSVNVLPEPEQSVLLQPEPEQSALLQPEPEQSVNVLPEPEQYVNVQPEQMYDKVIVQLQQTIEPQTDPSIELQQAERIVEQHAEQQIANPEQTNTYIEPQQAEQIIEQQIANPEQTEQIVENYVKRQNHGLLRNLNKKNKKHNHRH